MFQFPRFPLIHYVFMYEYARSSCVGFPIQKSAGQWIFAPYRSLSQLITSFIGSQCLGIHPMPVSYTHLDVYKRQRYSSLFHSSVISSSLETICSLCDNRYMNIVISFLVRVISSSLYLITPVSYTHLDVYKRQMLLRQERDRDIFLYEVRKIY